MNMETQFPYLGSAVSETPERGERVRFTESLAVFEEMHRALKVRVTETPEHQALQSLDAALSLVANTSRATRHLDLDGFSAFRGSIEVLHDNTPEARALELFEGALRSMIASATDFDDLPDEEEEAEDEIAEEAVDTPVAEDTAEDAPIVVTIYDAEVKAAQDAETHEAAETEDHTPASVEAGEAPAAGHETEATDLHAGQGDDGDTAGEAHAAEPGPDTDPAEIQNRIEELEAELAAARATHAA